MSVIEEEVVIRVKDPVARASGRVSHAVRHNYDADEIHRRRRELSAAQIAREIRKTIARGEPPTYELAVALCELIMSSVEE